MSEKPSEARGPSRRGREDSQRIDRKIRRTLGFEAFEKISAIEGMVISRPMKRDIMAASADHLSPSERSQFVLSRYGKK